MSYTTYKLIHLLGIFTLMVALAGMAGHAGAGHGKGENPGHRTLLFLHGIGALLALTGGFGLLARLDLSAPAHFPGWIWAKLILWVLLGSFVALPYRRQSFARAILLALPLFGLLGAVLANLRPF